MRAMCASTTSTEEVAPERMAAVVCSADHCQTGPLGGRALAGFCETAFFGVFAAARTADFFAGFFAAFALLFFLTVFFAISRPVAVSGNVKDAKAASRDGRGLLWVRGCPQSRLICRIVSQASSRRNSGRLGLWGDERGQEKGNLTEVSHAGGTPDKESNSNWQH
jgi:hypothetical protein